MISPQVVKLSIFPIKSLDGLTRSVVTVLPSGALQLDREFALIDSHNHFVNGKRQPKIHQLRCQVEPDSRWVDLQIQNSQQTFSGHLDQDREALQTWLGDFFGFPVTLQHNAEMGFPDDLNANGPTLISSATLETLASWFPGLSVVDMRQRLRTNIEISGVPPFWEDQLFSQAGSCVRFQIGDVILMGINPCQRCIVPTRDALTGTTTPHFQQTFTQQRRATLPAWTVARRFNHYYRVAVNTKIAATEAGKSIRLGDPLQILDVCESSLS